jgi:hypothetical protein
MFVVGWLFQEPDLRPLGMSLRPESLFQASSWVAFCWCSLELTNGGRANVGVQSLEATELQRDGKRTQTTKGESALRMAQIIAFIPHHVRGAHAGLFIGRAQQSYYIDLIESYYNAPNYLPHQ